MKSSSDIKPAVFQDLGNGSYYYNYNIVERKVTDENEEERTVYDFDSVQVWAPLTANGVVEATISDKWPANYEQKLVNEYNAALLGLYGEKTSEAAQARVAAYSDFLTERANIKADIDKWFTDEDCAF